MVSDLLRERLGPSSTYVESLISIQRAYINTNHPNFLGAAAAMSSVITAKQEKEKKSAMAEERRKRERRRLKEAGTMNGTETPEDDEANEDDKISTQGGPPMRPSANHHHNYTHSTKDSRSMSSNVRGMDHNSIATHLNGNSRDNIMAAAAAGSATGSTRDSFLNYFFGKDGQLPPGANSMNSSSSTMITSQNTRHVSHNNEPSFSQSIRRGDYRPSTVLSQYAESEYDRDQDRSRADPYRQPGADFDYSSPFVSSTMCPLTSPFLLPSPPPRFPFRLPLSLPSPYLRPTNTLPFSTTQPQQDDSPPLSDREALETELIRRLISSYFNIVRETIADQVPKAVMHLLVNHSKDVVQNRLVSELYREEIFEELLYEDDAIKQEREKCERMLGTYREAARIVGEVL